MCKPKTEQVLDGSGHHARKFPPVEVLREKLTLDKLKKAIPKEAFSSPAFDVVPGLRLRHVGPLHVSTGRLPWGCGVDVGAGGLAGVACRLSRAFARGAPQQQRAPESPCACVLQSFQCAP